jgi:hypothetical protein
VDDEGEEDRCRNHKGEEEVNAEQFNKIIELRCKTIKQVLSQKAKEYASPAGDRLIQFKNVARMNHNTPEQALWGMVSKHISALNDFIHIPVNNVNADSDYKEVSFEQWHEKIGDIINYMILLEALLGERGAM